MPDLPPIAKATAAAIGFVLLAVAVVASNIAYYRWLRS